MSDGADPTYEDVQRLVDRVEEWLLSSLEPPEPVRRTGDWALALDGDEVRPSAAFYIAIGGFTAWLQDSVAVDEVEFEYQGDHLTSSLQQALRGVLEAEVVEEAILPGLWGRRRQRLVPHGAAPRLGRLVREVRRWPGRRFDSRG